MKRNKILAAAALAAITATGALAVTARTSAAANLLKVLTTPQPPQTKKTVVTEPPLSPSAPLTNLATSSTTKQKQVSDEVPPQIVYHFFFKRMQLLEQKAKELDARGENGDAVRRLYQQTIGLTDEQNAFLVKTAVDCMADVKAIDDIAAPIIEQLSANYQNQPFSPNAPPPPPSDQLTALQNQHDQTVLSYRDLLKADFGDETSLRLEEFVKDKISSNIQSNVNLQNASVPAPNRNGAVNLTDNSTQTENAAPKENKR